MEVRTALLEQPSQRRDVIGEFLGETLDDGPSTSTETYDPVVVENGDAVGGQPDIALQTGGAELQGRAEGLDRVLRSAVTGAPVGEADRRIEQRR